MISFSDVEVDLERHLVRRKGDEIKVTRAEFKLLAFFLQNPDRPLTRDVLLNSVWGYDASPNTRTVDAHVVRLRQKLESDAETPKALRHDAWGRVPVYAVTGEDVRPKELLVEDELECSATLAHSRISSLKR